MRDTVLQNIGKCIDKIEHEGIGTCAIIKICEDADQKRKWFLKVHKAYKLLRFKLSFFRSFYPCSHFTNF